jgi:hypothetical protein
VAGGSATDDSHYLAVESQLASLTAERDALVAEVRTVLDNASFGTGTPASGQELEALIERGQEILSRAAELAAGGDDSNHN